MAEKKLAVGLMDLEGDGRVVPVKVVAKPIEWEECQRCGTLVEAGTKICPNPGCGEHIFEDRIY
jgi:hypothetical protein